MVRIDDGNDVIKCWLSPDELSCLERTAGRDDWTREIAMQLMGRCGLRADEVSCPADEHLRWSEDGDYWLVEHQVDVRTMMSIGGWSDYSAIEPYLAKPTEQRIGQAMTV